MDEHCRLFWVAGLAGVNSKPLSRMSFTIPECLFCRIVGGEIPADIIYSDEHVIAFRDIEPVADQHILIIPKKHIASLSHLSAEDMTIAAHIMLAAPKVAEKVGIAESGYRLVFNTGPDSLQSVFHIHGHLIGGQRWGGLHFPPVRSSTDNSFR